MNLKNYAPDLNAPGTNGHALAKTASPATTTLSCQDQLSPFIQDIEADRGNPDRQTIKFIVPTMNCAGCMSKIERHFAGDERLFSVRVNLSQKEVVFVWDRDQAQVENQGQSLLDRLQALGFEARPLMAEDGADEHEKEMQSLIRCLGVAGFAFAYVMLLSVSIWSGAEGATRDLFHWLSALIALPAIAYAGQPFFKGAWAALKAGYLNMDVPISLAVILAAGLSLFETATHGEHAFFDASVSLLFFLLIGRTLDRMMRVRAFQGVKQLLSLKSEVAHVIEPDGSKRMMSVRDLSPGMRVFVHPGETIMVDGRVIEGCSDVDWSLINGEALPQTAKRGDVVYSGLVNLSGPLTIEVEAVGERTLLSDIVRLMEEAQSNRPRYRQLADRAAALYAPVVHLAAGLTFVGWLLYGASWQSALYIAISVLIITCPCALGLAVPVVQVVASSLAQRLGVLMKDGAALESLSEVDSVVFDKTGTLTLAAPDLKRFAFHMNDAHDLDEMVLKQAAGALAAHSLHPLSRALSGAVPASDAAMPVLDNVQEEPGMGLVCTWRDGELKLGSRKWCGLERLEISNELSSDLEGADLALWVSFKDQFGQVSSAHFAFEDQLRGGIRELIAFLSDQNISVHLFSGDRGSAVQKLATQLGIGSYQAQMKPDEKAHAIAALQSQGAKVLMIGDGMNDGPSLKRADVSLSPSKASDLAQVSASFVLMKEEFTPIIDLFHLAKASRVLIWQNFMLALVYNLIAIPLAVMGGVTPIMAALAMSGSSLIVMANALRLHFLIRPNVRQAQKNDTANQGPQMKDKDALLEACQ